MAGHHAPVLSLVAKRRWTRGAELGLDSGELSRRLLMTSPEMSMVGVDNFTIYPDNRKHVIALAADYPTRFTLLEMSTYDAADHVEDGSLDFVFIDAEHSEEATRSDILRWRPKVRAGGWISGDAYNPQWYPQVVRAVHSVFDTAQVKVYPHRVWGVWL